MTSTTSHFLRLGQSAKVARGFMSRWSVLYAGTLDDGTCSIVVTWSCGYNSMAYNLYLPARPGTFQVGPQSVALEQFSPEAIEIRCPA